MKKKKIVYIGSIIFGIALIAIGGFFLTEENVKKESGILIGIGAGVFGAAVANLWMLHFYETHPQKKKQVEIDETDERNQLIRDKAKAKGLAGIRFLMLPLVVATFVVDIPLWVSLSLIGTVIASCVVEGYFLLKYNKEM